MKICFLQMCCEKFPPVKWKEHENEEHMMKPDAEEERASSLTVTLNGCCPGQSDVCGGVGAVLLTRAGRAFIF